MGSLKWVAMHVHLLSTRYSHNVKMADKQEDCSAEIIGR